MLRKAFANRSVNLLNLHFGIYTFAEGLINVFLAVYLFRLGLSLPLIFLSLGIINLLRLFFRPLVLSMCYAIGIRRTLIFGTLSFLPVYPLLTKVQGGDIWLWLFLIVAAVPYTFYWTSYHPYFSILGDVEHRGKQVGIRELALQSGATSAPLAGGILLGIFGFRGNVLLAMAGVALATIPLFFTGEAPLGEKLRFREALKKVGKEGFWLFFADNIYIVAHDIAWRLTLFAMLQNYISYGGLLSLAIFLQMIGSLLTGYWFDNGGGKKSFPMGIGIVSLVIIGRAFFADTIPEIVFLDICFMLGYALYLPVRDSVIYNLSKKSHCPLWFHYFAEVGADLGAIVSYLAAAAFVGFSGEIRFFITFSILALGLSGMILRNYFSPSRMK